MMLNDLFIILHFLLESEGEPEKIWIIVLAIKSQSIIMSNYITTEIILGSKS